MTAISRRIDGLATAALAFWQSIEIAIGAVGFLGDCAHKMSLVFEPLCTTKRVGKRTCVGSASVCGMVREHRRRMLVDSAWLRALFVWGYNDSVRGARRMLKHELQLLEKPFFPATSRRRFRTPSPRASGVGR